MSHLVGSVIAMKEPDVTDRILEEVSTTSPEIAYAYLCGGSRDATRSRRHSTIRYAQSDPNWLFVIQRLLETVGFKSWMYREGRSRGVFVVESRCPIQPWPPIGADEDAAAFIRGYFDAEGGIPRGSAQRFYVQFTQKDKHDLKRVRDHLEQLGIQCGVIHNPSVRADPDYWRFYVLSGSHKDFIERVRSWHPRKRALLQLRLGSSSRCNESAKP